MKGKKQNDSKIKESLFRFLRGRKLQDQQYQELKDWYHSLYADQDQIDSEELKKLKEDSLMEIRRAIQFQEKKQFSWYSLTAAVFALIFLSTISIFSIYFFDLTDSDNRGHDNWITLESGAGERKSIFLPDSSKVYISGNSTISYSENYLNNRDVKLVGQAFFEVVSNKDKPFIVHTEKLNTTVLGTSFNISARKGEEERVDVKTGKVNVKQREGTKQTTLTKGQRVTTQNRQMVTSLISNKEEVFAWIDNTLIFNNITISEMAEKLEDWYGIEVRTKEKFNTCRITGKYQGQSIDEVLKIINYSINLKYQWENEKLIIEKVTCE
ncbi:DUF4974 domain-containing protein [Belliella sp. R4-6]|uniref:DUF4974 domain-containing protein n=1 Tax=Belliella alkalica TaxID=1730871 RepID=A0ABS9V6L4_9BACT|nr:FecR family protein [Belliella alkalica]MCH7412018.1 DUF4974 domain-containing protein [Belliella alkalica]